MEQITCKIINVVFSNKQTGYFVLRTKLTNSTQQITVKGSFPEIDLDSGLKITVKGDYENNPTYGKQFSAVSCEIIPELGKIGIVSYLINHVKSIGPVTASRLYDVFGDDLLNVLNNDPDKIKELEFLNKSQIKSIIDEWKNASMVRSSSIFLIDIGLNSQQVKSVFSVYGQNSRKVIEENPYDLCNCSVGFSTADRAARKLGVGVDDPKRIRSMILFFIKEMCNSDGHMYTTSHDVLEYSKKVFKKHSIEQLSNGDFIPESVFYKHLSELQKNKDVVYDNMNIYLPYNWTYEDESAKQVALMVKNGGLGIDTVDMINKFEAEMKLNLSDDQKNALELLNKSRIFVVSGYPGTGKTTLVSAFVNIFDKLNISYTLMSPTGIAAKRLSQVTNKPAYTIHRALGCDHDGNWEFNSCNKFATNAIIVDEVSMVDAKTFYHLITALNSNTIVILTGDSAQLPSVGSGYVLHELMNSVHVPHVSLTKIYRQEGCSDIINVAHSILNGNNVDTTFNRESEFIFINTTENFVINEIEKVTSIMKKKGSNFQVMAPMYDGDLGVNNLNNSLRNTLNDRFISGNSVKIKHGDTDIYEGDRIMVIKNNYEKMIFNGDVGKVQKISIKNDEVEVKMFNWFDSDSLIPRYIDKVFSFKIEEVRSTMKVAYACTVHKCQGQEFDYVILPMTMKYSVMLYKNLVYTAITRAKKKVFLFGDPTAFDYSIRNNREMTRNSNLSGLTESYIK